MNYRFRAYLRSHYFAALFAALFFMVAGAVTVRDYGPSWDEAVHFSRGQAYLNFFLTGSKDYSNLSVPRRSFYQFDYHSGDYWFADHGGHPPISDIIAAYFNYILYQRLGLVGDIYSYHLFNILVSSFLVFIVVLFASSTFGKFPAIISFLALFTYPLFFAESHFNVKDPPEAAFFAATILFFYLALIQKSQKKLFLSFVFFALGLGTKFNILFLPVIIFLYLFIHYKLTSSGKAFETLKNYWIVPLIGGIFIVTLFIASWPFLWDNLPQNLVKVFNFYKQIGTGTVYQPSEFFIFGFNTFPIQWILFTTPPISLVLLLVGIISVFINRKIENGLSILWLLWFVVPIARVTFPGTSIYGGIRQIMEFLPALALLSGLGAWQIIDWLRDSKWRNIVAASLILAFLWPTYILFKMHPNQNAYFNSLIGGLRGAQDRNFPSWGNSYGNAYFQGVKWINAHAPTGAKVALIQGIEVNTPDLLYRPDISLNNSHWSGIEGQGEYMMELTFNDTGRAFHYAWEYAEFFLEPVYELKVDEVAILKIWKNDLEHTRPDYRLVERKFLDPFQLNQVKNTLELDLGKKLLLSRLILRFEPNKDCLKISNAFVETLADGLNWVREKDWIPFPQVANRSNLQDNTINFYVAAREVRSIRFWFESDKSCGLARPSAEVYLLSKGS